MKEQLISFETAKLAKEKKFDIETKLYYVGGNILQTLEDNTEHLYRERFTINPAPTQSLLQKWLRKEHSIQLSINIYWQQEKHKFTYKNQIFEPHEINKAKMEAWESTTHYDTFEEALEFGLRRGLKLIK